MGGEKRFWEDFVGTLDEVEAPAVAEDAAVQAPVKVETAGETPVRAAEGVVPAQASVVETPVRAGEVSAPTVEVEVPVASVEEAGAPQAAAAETSAPVAVEVPVKGARVEEAPPEKAQGPEGEHPAPAERVEPEMKMTFAAGVARARVIAGAAEDAVVPLGRDLGERELSAGRYTKNEWKPAGPELDEETVEDMKMTLERVQAGGFTRNSGLEVGLAEMQRQIDKQDEYREFREYAEELTAGDLPVLRKALKELSPGMFGVEAALQKEMGKLGGFFEELGDLDKQRAEVTEWEELKKKPLMLKLMDDKKRKVQEAEVARTKERIASHESVYGLLSMKNMPVELRSVIEAARERRYFDFGQGPIAEFRQKIYRDILNSLGLELADRPAVSTPVQAEAAPAAEAVPAAGELVAKEDRKARGRKLKKDFDREYGKVPQTAVDEMADQIDSEIDQSMKAGRTAEETAIELNTAIEESGDMEEAAKQARHAMVAVARRTAESDRLTDEEKRKKLAYLSGMTGTFFGAMSAGSSLMDFIIKSFTESISGK